MADKPCCCLFVSTVNQVSSPSQWLGGAFAMQTLSVIYQSTGNVVDVPLAKRVAFSSPPPPPSVPGR